MNVCFDTWLPFLSSVVECEGEQAEDVSSELVKEASPPSENADQEVIVEALKSICNILLHNETGQVSLLCLFAPGIYMKSSDCVGANLNPLSGWVDGWMNGRW